MSTIDQSGIGMRIAGKPRQALPLWRLKRERARAC